MSSNVCRHLLIFKMSVVLATAGKEIPQEGWAAVFNKNSKWRMKRGFSLIYTYEDLIRYFKKVYGRQGKSIWYLYMKMLLQYLEKG